MAGAEPRLTEGRVADALRAEFPGLRLHCVRVASAPRRSPPEVRDRLRALSDRIHGARAVAMRGEPVPHAHRVFFRHVGLDPDVQRVPAEAALVERLLRGGYESRGLPADALLIALVDTGIGVVGGRRGQGRRAAGAASRGRGRAVGGRRWRRPDRAAVRRSRRGRRTRPEHPRAAALRRAGAERPGPLHRGGAVDLRGAARVGRERPAGGVLPWWGGVPFRHGAGAACRTADGCRRPGRGRSRAPRRAVRCAPRSAASSASSARWPSARSRARGSSRCPPVARAARGCCPSASSRCCATSSPPGSPTPASLSPSAPPARRRRARCSSRCCSSRDRHRFVKIANADLGVGGCGVWHVRPRLGLIGMLMGWWQVKLSSGCPLSPA